jgi:hypothetical protein
MEGFMHSSSYFKTISQILILAMLHLCWLTSYGYAEMVPTESANQSQYQDDRQRILDLLDRQDVVDELGKYGINKVEAVTRINSLTDEEVTQIAGKLDELSEGGGSSKTMGFIILLFLYPLVWLMYAFTLVTSPIAMGVCVFVEDPWGDCFNDYLGWPDKIGRSYEAYWESHEDYQPDTEPLENDDCDPGMESCDDFTSKYLESNGHDGAKDKSNTSKIQASKYDPEKNFENLIPQAEVPCIGQFNSCIKWADNPQQVEQCNEDKQMCLQVYSPCDADYSSCLKKVGRAISSEQYCVEEKQKCITKVEWSSLK